jgi:hypothetical protein
MTDASKVGEATTVGIDYPNDHHALRGVGGFRLLESYGREASQAVCDDTRKRIPLAMKRFPELAGDTVTVACRQPWDTKLGRADMRNRIVWLPADHASTFITVYHELAHLAIQILDEDGHDVAPSSERYTGLFGIARMPPGHVDEQRIPYFDIDYTVSKEQLPAVADHALAYRQSNHDYHQQAIRWLTGEEGLPEDDPAYPEAIE